MSAPAETGPARTAPRGPDAAADKVALRARVRATRDADPRRPEADAARLPRLLDACAGHTGVACYHSLAAEPDTSALIAALSDAGVRLLLPVLKGRRTPAWGWYAGPDSLVPGWRGIPEPAGDALGPDALGACSFVWVSALLATPRGFRLGTGGGWYDRALAHAAPDAVVGTLVGDDEVVDAVPLEPWDIPVDLVVTPTRTLVAGSARLPGTQRRTE